MKKLKAKLLFAAFILALVIGIFIGGGSNYSTAFGNIPVASERITTGFDTEVEHVYKRHVKVQEEIFEYSLPEVVVTAKVSKPSRNKGMVKVKIPVTEKSEESDSNNLTKKVVETINNSQTINNVEPLTIKLLDTANPERLIVEAQQNLVNLLV